jgi:hypothetical protein
VNEVVTNDVGTLPALLGASLGDTGKDLAEIAIDSVLKDGVLKDIPIVGAIAGFCKLGISIRERNLLKQILIFINSFNAGTIAPEKLEEYRRIISEDPKKAEEELGRCMIILNSTIETVHSCLLGRLYNSYVKGSISWDKFVELSDASQRLFVEDIRHLKEIDRQPEEHVAVKTANAYNYFRLQSIGLLTSGTGVFELKESGSGGIDLDSNVFTISPFGKAFI